MIKKYIYNYVYKKLDDYIRHNIGFEINEGSYKRIKLAIDRDINFNNNIYYIVKKYFYYKKRLKLIPIDIPKNCYKILLLYNKKYENILFNNYDFEKEFSNNNIILVRKYYKKNYIKKKYKAIIKIDSKKEISYTLYKNTNIPIIKIYIYENINIYYIKNVVDFITKNIIKNK